MNTKKYNVLDLFCGCGGLSKGFEMAGYHILLGVDFNAPALKTYEANHKGSKTLCGDLSSLETFQTIDSLVEEYNGKQIFVPVEQFYRPNLTYLRHHRENVFNTFRQIRKL